MKTALRALIVGISLLILGIFTFAGVWILGRDAADEHWSGWQISSAPTTQNRAILSEIGGYHGEIYSGVGVASGTQKWRRLWPATHENTSPEMFWSRDGQILAVREPFLELENSQPRKKGCEWTTAFDFSKNQVLNAKNEADRATSLKIQNLVRAHGGAICTQWNNEGKLSGWKWRSQAENSLLLN